MFLRNYWYVAAWDHELRDKPLGRTLLGEPVVLFRDASGAPVALEDRCVHRRLPLSLGRIVGDRLQCGYHGLEFDRAGRCVAIPGQNESPPGARIKSYPVVERHRWIWIWMADPAQADPAEIPDFHWLDDPAWGAKGSLLYVRCDWQLIIDNLLDLTHLTFVHRATIGNTATTDNAEVSVDRGPDFVRVTRWMMNIPPPPTYVRMGGFSGNVDRWQIIEYTPAGNVRLDIGATPAGTGARQGIRRGGIGMRNLNAVTPESEHTTHYFWAQAHDFTPHDSAITDRLFGEIEATFSEDWAILEAQQRAIDREPAAPVIDIRADAGPLQARRIIERMYASENDRLPAAVAE
jgi:phenylpropionate dioxygenase-like ring-hydroxylating dioxygenase large terminal subunit